MIGLFEDFIAQIRKIIVPNWVLLFILGFLIGAGLLMYATAALVITLLFMLPTLFFLGGIDVMSRWATNDFSFQQARRKRKRQPIGVTPAEYVQQLSRLSDDERVVFEDREELNRQERQRRQD